MARVDRSVSNKCEQQPCSNNCAAHSGGQAPEQPPLPARRADRSENTKSHSISAQMPVAAKELKDDALQALDPLVSY